MKETKQEQARRVLSKLLLEESTATVLRLVKKEYQDEVISISLKMGVKAPIPCFILQRGLKNENNS